MRCKECGIEVDNLEVFCPNCGAPLRMTADYDFIQAEIGGKVDQFLNDKDFYPSHPDRSNAAVSEKSEPDKTIIAGKKQGRPAADPELTIIGEKPRHESENGDTIAVTKAIYGKDSVFAVDGTQIYDDLSDEEYDNEAFEEEARSQYPEEEVSGKGRPSGRSERELSRIKARAKERKRKKRKKIILFSILGAIVVLAAVAVIIAVTGKKENEPEKDLSDTITSNVEEGGTYSTPFELTLWSEKDYRICYTLDGSEPSVTSPRYGQPIRFTNADISGDSLEVTVKVATFMKDASIIGGKSTFHFTLVRSELTPPYMEPDSGDYYEPEYITIHGPDGADIYFTYDGSTPSKNSTLYTGPIQMKRGNFVLNAIAIDKSGVQSEVASYVYNLIVEPVISEDYAYDLVLQELLDAGLIEDDEPDENGQYKVPGGGIRRINRGGMTIIENESFYVIQVDYSNDGQNVQATTYYGINDQTGELTRLNKSGMSYSFG